MKIKIFRTAGLAAFTLIGVQLVAPGLLAQKENASTRMSAVSPTAVSTAEQPTAFAIPPERLQLIGVTYVRVERRTLSTTIRAVGTVAFDKLKHWDYVSRVDGYIQSLKVSSPGDEVRKGQVLMDIYSPDLAATENEFLNLLTMRDQALTSGSAPLRENADHLIEAARLRLRQWNLSEAQIDALVKTRQPSEYIELTSPFKGVVQNIDVDQGRHVATGDHLVDVVDLSTVWVWAEFYQNELYQIKPGSAVEIIDPSSSAGKIPGTVSVVDPIFNEMKHTGRVRIEVPNPTLQLHPGMYTDVAVEVDHGSALTVPFSAVLPTGKHDLVYVDQGGGKLLPRYIEVQGPYGDFYQVVAGLHEGERIVASGNFLIDAEAKIQGAVNSE